MMASEAFELADELHIERAHREVSDEIARLAAALDAACSELAELRSRHDEHTLSYHHPEPEPEAPPEEEPIVVPPPEEEPPEEAPPPPDEPPAPSHPMLRRIGGRE